jgi:hypothetical protein
MTFRLAISVCLTLGSLAGAQDAPESRRERWRFRKIKESPDVSGRGTDKNTVTDASRDLEVHVRVGAEDVARYVENRRRK